MHNRRGRIASIRPWWSWISTGDPGSCRTALAYIELFFRHIWSGGDMGMGEGGGVGGGGTGMDINTYNEIIQ